MYLIHFHKRNIYKYKGNTRLFTISHKPHPCESRARLVLFTFIKRSIDNTRQEISVNVSVKATESI